MGTSIKLSILRLDSFIEKLLTYLETESTQKKTFFEKIEKLVAWQGFKNFLPSPLMLVTNKLECLSLVFWGSMIFTSKKEPTLYYMLALH